MKPLIKLLSTVLLFTCTGLPNSCPAQPPATTCDLVDFGLVLHLESDLGITENAGSVSLWADQSGQGNNLDGFGNPQLITSGGPNGQSYLALDGIDDKFEQFLCLSGLPVSNADRTLFFVSRYNGNNADAGFAYGEGSPNKAFGLISKTNGELAIQAYGENNDRLSGIVEATPIWLSQAVVLSGDNFSHYKNGNLINNGTYLFDTGGEKIIIGSDIGGVAGFSEMDVAAILVYNRALSEIERQQVEQYLQEKYFGQACSQDPVIYNVAIAEEAACNGDNAEFTVQFNVLDGSGNYDVIDVGNSNAILPTNTGLQSTLSGFSIGVSYPGPTASSVLQIDVVDSNDPLLVGGVPRTVAIPQCPSCNISNVRVAQQAVCDGVNNRFTVFFDVSNGSGDYQVISNSSEVLATLLGAPKTSEGLSIEVAIPGTGGSSILTFEVIDASDPLSCVGQTTETINLFTCQQVPGCTIDNVIAPVKALCNGNDAELEVTFDVNGGSGNYQALDLTTNQVLGSVAGGATASGLTIPITITASLSSSVLIDVVDAADPLCSSGRPRLVYLPTCPAPSSCDLLESNLVFSLEADQGVTETGGTVSMWDDQTGSNHLSAIGDPTLENVGGPNGQPYIAFDGDGDKMERISSISGLPTGLAPRTMFVVARYQTNNFTAGVTYGNAGGNQAFGLGINTGAKLTVVGYGPFNDQASPETGLNAWLSQSVVAENFSYTHYRDGKPIDSGNHTFNTIINKMILAGQIDNSGVIDMDIAAIFIYDGVLTGPQRQQVEAYIQAKYFGKDCPLCEISQVAVTADPACNGADAKLNVTFNAVNGSGSYEVFNANNPNEVLGSITGAAATAKQISIPVTLVDVALQGSLDIDVRDSEDNNCFGGIPQTVVIPACPAENSVQIGVKVMLEGPFDSSSGLMNDLLRTQQLIPSTDPYGLGATADPSVFENQAGPENDVVDWVRLELRKKDNQGNPTVVVGSAAGLVKRNGTVIAPDGKSSVFFYDTFACDYYLAVYHRNHLAVMTENTIMINNDIAN